MKSLIAITSLIAAGLITFFVTVPQFMCKDTSCSYNGIRALKANQASFSAALASAQNLESRRAELTEKYNNINPEDLQKLENLLPNNVDNIKLVLELETLAKRYGLLIESPKLETKSLTSGDVATNAAGQVVRGSNANVAASLPYGTFTLDFTVRASYENIKLLISDIEKNLRLIEPVSITLNVPGIDSLDKTKTVYPPGIYDVTIKAVIYYLKD